MADQDKLDGVRLDEASARRLIERATELDAKLGSQSTVAELRDAARGAGISEEAFGRALAEVQQPAARSLRPVPRRSVLLPTIVAVGAVLLLTFGFFALRVIPNRVAEDRASAVGRPGAAPAAPAYEMPVAPPPPSTPAPRTKHR